MKKKIMLTVGIVLGIAALGYGGYLVVRPAPKAPGESATAKERMEFMASADFKRLPVEEQRKLMTHNRPNPGEQRERVQLTDEQRKQLNENTRELRNEMMKQRLKDYFAKSEKERLAELKKMQQQMATRQKEMEQRRQLADQNGTATQERKPPQGGDRELRLRERLDNSDPETRALRTAMMKEMRRAGIQPPQRPPRS